MIRPQQKQRKQHEERLRNLKRGDEVVTAGGVVGEVMHIKEALQEDGTHRPKSMEDRITIKSGERARDRRARTHRRSVLGGDPRRATEPREHSRHPRPRRSDSSRGDDARSTRSPTSCAARRRHVRDDACRARASGSPRRRSGAPNGSPWSMSTTNASSLINPEVVERERQRPRPRKDACPSPTSTATSSGRRAWSSSASTSTASRSRSRRRTPRPLPAARDRPPARQALHRLPERSSSGAPRWRSGNCRRRSIRALASSRPTWPSAARRAPSPRRGL